jgi:hypothetical protein
MGSPSFIILVPDKRGWHPGFYPTLVDVMDRTGVEYTLKIEPKKIEVHLRKAEHYETKYIIKLIQRSGYEVALPLTRSNQ